MLFNHGTKLIEKTGISVSSFQFFYHYASKKPRTMHEWRTDMSSGKFGSPCPTFPVRQPVIPGGLAHNPSGAGSQPLVGKLPRGCEQAGLEGHA